MLAQLLIRNFAIIEQTELDLNSGMSALTGETGAGKSILLDALGLVLGDRADTDSIRDGCSKADITAVFHPMASSPIWQWLHENDLDQPDECILRRVVSRDNRSRAYINSSPVALQMLKTAGEMLVNIHGQHEHQSLTRSDHQRQLLDEHSQNGKLLDKLYKSYKAWETINLRYEETRSQLAQREQRIEMLKFQYQELDSLELDEDELNNIEADHKRAANSGHLFDLADLASNELYENENSAYSKLMHVEKTLKELQGLDDQADEYLAMVNSAAIQCSEAASGLRNYLGGVEADPGSIQWLEDRLSALHHMAHKHQITIAELLPTYLNIRRELDELENSDLTFESLDKSRLEKEAAYRKVAEQLSRSRLKGAKSMSTAISGAMQNLAMKDGVFAIEISEKTSSRPSIHGIDDIQFMVSANPGQKPRAIGKVASGGELSRISLAIQLIAAEHKVVETMIFDEVDSGVGGAVAETVGQYLRKLSRNCQVLCVTHLPQVAAQAHNHLQVSKTSDGEKTETRLTALDNHETIEEVARMLGGKKITKQTRDHATEMINSAVD